jgi:hypothetical protein
MWALPSLTTNLFPPATAFWMDLWYQVTNSRFAGKKTIVTASFIFHTVYIVGLLCHPGLLAYDRGYPDAGEFDLGRSVCLNLCASRN